MKGFGPEYFGFRVASCNEGFQLEQVMLKEVRGNMPAAVINGGKTQGC